jgi:CelD/BcsL family acetyltransferase involved in cellulose biosynthesis
MQIKVVSNFEKAQSVWNQLSPKEFWYDEWDVRYLFHQAFNYPIRFYTCFHLGKPVAVLPLQLNTQDQVLEFFGTGYCEENRVFYAHGFSSWITSLYQSLKEPARLATIRSQNEFTEKFALEDYKYTLSLANYSTLDDYLKQEFRAKRRKNIKRSLREIEEKNIELAEGNPQNLELLFQLNLQRFGKDSSFYKSYLPDVFRQMLSLNYQWQLLTFKIAGQKRAVSLAVLYQDTYLYHNSGTDLRTVPNLGTLVLLKNIERAILSKAKVFDAGLENLGWKERWHFQKIPQYQFINS